MYDCVDFLVDDISLPHDVGAVEKVGRAALTDAHWLIPVPEQAQFKLVVFECYAFKDRFSSSGNCALPIFSASMMASPALMMSLSSSMGVRPSLS